MFLLCPHIFIASSSKHETRVTNCVNNNQNLRRSFPNTSTSSLIRDCLGLNENEIFQNKMWSFFCGFLDVLPLTQTSSTLRLAGKVRNGVEDLFGLTPCWESLMNENRLPGSSSSSLLCLSSMFFLSWDEPNWVLCLLHSWSNFWFMVHLTSRFFYEPPVTSSPTWHLVLMAECWLCSLGYYDHGVKVDFVGSLWARYSLWSDSQAAISALIWGDFVCGTLQLLL